MAEPFLPYETSLMILRYLYSQGCRKTAAEFMNEMTCLKNACKNPETLILPSVFGGLNDILNDYGRTKLLVKDLVTKLAQWEAISENGVSPHDTLTTQLRVIIQLLSSIFGPSSSSQITPVKRKDHDKPKTLDFSKSVQTSPDAPVIRTKKVASTCTSMDGVLSGCWSICSCLHTSSPVKDVLEMSTQTDFPKNEDNGAIVPSAFIDESAGTEIREEFIDISEEEDILDNENEVNALGEDENESDITERIEGDADAEKNQKISAEKTASFFYTLLLEDEFAQNSIANFANHYRQQLEENRDSPVKPNLVPAEIDKFLHDLISDDPDLPNPDTEMEEGEIADDSQDNIGEFQAAERSLISHFKSQTPTSSPIAVTVSSSLEAEARTVNTNASFQLVSQHEQVKTNKIGEESLSHHAVNDTESFILVHATPPIQRSTHLPDSISPETNADLQGIKSSEGLNRAPLQKAQLPKRAQTAWQKIGRRSIAPKIPNNQSSALTTPVTAVCAATISASQTPAANVVHERPSTPLNQTSNPESKPGMFQHLIGSVTKMQNAEFLKCQTKVNTNTLQHVLEREKKCYTTPRKQYVRNLRFNSPQIPNDNESIRTVNLVPNKTEGLPIPEFKPTNSNKGKAQKALFPSLSQANEVQPAANSVPVHNHNIGQIQNEDKAISEVPKSEVAKPDRKRSRSPDKMSKLCNRTLQNRTSTTSTVSASPPKKLKIEMDQTKKRPIAGIQKPQPDTRKPSPQNDAKQNNRRNSTSTPPASQKSTKTEARCSDSAKNATASVVSSSKVFILSNETKRPSIKSLRKRKEPGKLMAGEKLSQNSATQSAVVTTEATANLNLQQALSQLPVSGSYTDLNFVVPRTPRYKGVVDSDWESQSSETFESIFSQRLPLLTPIKDIDLPITPGKNLDLQRGINDNVGKTSERKSMFSAAMNAALRREAEKRALDTPNVNNFVSQLKKPDYMPGSAFPQGHGQLVKQTPTSEVQQPSESQSNVKKENNPEPKQNSVIETKSQAKTSQSGMKQSAHPPNRPDELRSIAKPKLTQHPESRQNVRNSQSQSVKFAVAGKSKQLTRLEHATAISLCQLSQVGSPDPKLLMTPRSSPPPEVEDKLDSNGIEDLLLMLHGRKQ